MNWKKIAGLTLAFLGTLGIAGGVMMLAVMTYYNIMYGAIEPSVNGNEPLDDIALTWQNVATGFGYLIGGGLGLLAGTFLFRHAMKPSEGRNR